MEEPHFEKKEEIYKIQYNFSKTLPKINRNKNVSKKRIP